MSHENERPHSLRSRNAALVALIACLSMSLPATEAAGQPGLPPMPPTTIPSVPPPVPECWYTGTTGDYGTPCPGMAIPAGGTVVLFTHPGKDGVFHLTGPAPLQTKQHVSCGAESGICLYNHMDWTVGAERVSGCETNSTTCDVRVPKGAGWEAVYVRQNTGPKLLYALWGGLPGGIISGTVTDDFGAGVPGVAVTAAGPGGGSATTDYLGFYTMNVLAGNFRVSAGPQYDPTSTDVTVPPGADAGASFMARGYEVGGVVYGRPGCSCSPEAVGGVPVLVTGTATNGKAVKATAVSKVGTGKWSLRLPAGSYTAGPTLDGKTFAGPVFTPATHPVVLANGPSWGNDFVACLQGSSAGPSSENLTEGRMLPAARVAAGARFPTAAQCQSVYTVTLSGGLPQGPIVDPSRLARHATTYGPHYKSANNLVGALAKALPWNWAEHQYPACFDEEASEAHEGHSVEWYSYILGQGLGKVTLKLLWSWAPRQAGQPLEVTPIGPVVRKPYPLTKVYQWLDVQTRQKGSCQEPGDSKIMAAVQTDGTSFTMEVVWGFGFPSVTGVKGGEPPGVIERRIVPLLDNFGPWGKKLHQSFDKLTPGQKFQVVTTISMFSLLAAMHIVVAPLVALAPAALAAAGVSAAEAEALVETADVLELLHKAHSVSEALEVLNAFGGSYPIAAAIVRGEFSLERGELVTANHMDYYVGGKTTLALSVVSTKFPSVALLVQRRSYPENFSRLLPWANNPLPYGNVSIANTFSQNPAASYLVNVLANPGAYASGQPSAYDAMWADTAQLPRLRDAVTMTGGPYPADKNGVSWAGLRKEVQDEAIVPACKVDINHSDQLETASDNTICWRMNDGSA
jgi:hypothetical protein